MSRGFSVNRMSVGLAIIAACPVGLAMAAGTISPNGASAQFLAALFGAPDSNKAHEARQHEIVDGSLADAVEAAQPAVFSVRVSYRLATGERGASAPLDRSRNPPGQPSPETQPRVRTSQGSGFFISADGYAVTCRHVTAESGPNITVPPRVLATPQFCSTIVRREIE